MTERARKARKRGAARRKKGKREEDGANGRTRTADLRFTKPLLCLLSYVGNRAKGVKIKHKALPPADATMLY